MSRYVDVDLLIKNIANIPDLRTLSTKTIGEAIRNTPTEDVTRVIRCKECKHYETEGLNGSGVCGKIQWIMDGYFLGTFEVKQENDFCSYAERREENKNAD